MKALTYDDVLLIPAYNHYDSRKLVDTSMTDRTGKLTLNLPVFSANMDTITGHKMAKFIHEKGGIGVLHRFMTIEKNVEEYKKYKSVFVSVGCGDKEFERLDALYMAGATYICVDVAHAHAKYVGKMLKRTRDLVRDNVCIMAGNVATYAGADYLASCGADLIKVGIGGGSVCTTRIKTGFGVPNLTAIRDCNRVGRSIIADGGIRTPGDIVKALAFGADFVMIGSMLAGTEPTPGAIKNRDSNLFKEYRGMASKEVADDHNGGLTEWKTAEGVSCYVPYRSNQDEIIKDIVGGLRSGLTYSGSINIKELQRKLNYVEITEASLIENKPHRLL